MCGYHVCAGTGSGTALACLCRQRSRGQARTGFFTNILQLYIVMDFHFVYDGVRMKMVEIVSDLLKEKLWRLNE